MAVAAILTLVVVVLMAVAMPKFKKMQTLVDRLNLVSPGDPYRPAGDPRLQPRKA